MTKGQKIKKLREENGLTKTELAAKVGVATQTIFKYENEIITNIPLDNIEKLAVVLNVTPAYIMGWENIKTSPLQDISNAYAPNITEEYTTFPVIGEIAAGYDHIAIESWEGDTVDVPDNYLQGRDKNDFFVLRVTGDSMYPLYQDGDKVLILKQTALNYSGAIGAVIYDDEIATLKKVEFVSGENWLRLIPINPNVPPIFIDGERLDHCKIVGIPKLLIREITQ